ncbi:MAG: hypothetical protein ABW221_19240 [Vicinamibacteria bacterium]
MRDPLARRVRAARLAGCLVLAGTPSARAAVPAPALSDTRAVRTLAPEDAEELRPVHLRAVVTYHHAFPGWIPLFVQDATGGVYVEVRQALPVVAGDVVEVDGFTGAGMFAPVVLGARVRAVGRAELPAPASRTIDALLDGSSDSQWVEIEGVVRQMERIAAPSAPADRLYALTLASGQHEVRAIVRAGPEDAPPPSLVDARVRVRGAASTLYTARRQIVDIQLQSPGFEHVQVIAAAPADPFARPVHAVTRLFQFDPRGSSGQRVRVQGAVSAVGPGPAFYLKDESGGLRVELSAPLPGLKPGDVLDVAGFPELGEYSPVLRSAVARLLRHGPVPAARAVLVPEAMTGDFDGLPVEIEGTLVDRAPDREGAALVLRAGDLQFRVEVLTGDTRHLSAGSVLRVRGTCLAQTGFDNRVHSFRIVAASASDVVVTREGDFWTLARALWALAALAVLLALGLVWNVRLRRGASRSLAHVRVLTGLLPICAWCKKIRDDNGYWSQVETYIRERSEAEFSHGICPDCVARESGQLRRQAAAIRDAAGGPS